MQYYGTNIVERLSIKDSYLSKQVQNVHRWNKLSIADQDPEFLEELNQVISDSSIPDIPDDDTKSDVGKISEAPTNVPNIHDKNIIPSYAYSNMGLGLLRGSDNTLMHALVKIRNINGY